MSTTHSTDRKRKLPSHPQLDSKRSRHTELNDLPFNNQQQQHNGVTSVEQDENIDYGTIPDTVFTPPTCAYLDTVSRLHLDFDFLKQCSLTLTTQHIYCCLVCGKYFTGRGKTTPAYLHSIQLEHHIFLSFDTLQIYCLPDNYIVTDPSLNDIIFNARPVVIAAMLQQCDEVKEGRVPFTVMSLTRQRFIPGLIGLNNLNKTSWLSVCLQLLNTVRPLRNYFLLHFRPSANTSIPPLIQQFITLLHKIWNTRSFKAHCSPHEFAQAIIQTANTNETAMLQQQQQQQQQQQKSQKLTVMNSLPAVESTDQITAAPVHKRFEIGSLVDPIEFLTFFLNTVQRQLQQVNGKSKSTIIQQCFRGEIRIVEYVRQRMKRKIEVNDDDDEMKQSEDTMTSEENQQSNEAETDYHETTTITHRPFLYLSLALPPFPLFQNVTDAAVIPNMPLTDLLYDKFSTEQETVSLNGDTITRRRFSITRLPRFLILHIQRFSHNEYQAEKNSTIVNFPLCGLDLSPYLFYPHSKSELNSKSITQLKAIISAYDNQHASLSAIEKSELVDAAATLQQRDTPKSESCLYDLRANICHQGKSKSCPYMIHVLHQPTNTWYAVQDLKVETQETQTELVALSEAYIQIYERRQQ